MNDERWYQKGAITATLAYLRVNKQVKHPLVVAPTGSGKTHIIAGLCDRIHKQYPKLEVIVLSHVQEILKQDYAKLKRVIPEDKIGVYSAGLGKREIKQYTIAGIQSVYKKPHLFEQTKLIIVDEAHLIPPGSEGMYKKFFDAFPNVPILGLTATPFRLGSGYLTDKGNLFDDIVYEVDIKRLIKEGYLCKLRSKEAKEQIDTSKLKVVAGDFSSKSMSHEVDRFGLTNAICDELVKHKERKHWLVFAVDIKHAEHVAEALNLRGVSSAAYHSKMNQNDRELILRLYKAGKIQCVVNVEALTTGFDFPEIDLIGLLRPTKSPVLHVQMCGRGLRISDTKEDTLILDFAGNLQRLGPIDKVAVEPPKLKGKGAGRPPVKVCPQCDEVVPIKALTCDACGWTFEINTKLTKLAAEASIISDDNDVPLTKELNVNKVYYYKHEKENKLPSLKVVYMTNNARVYNEWKFFEHGGGLQADAVKWWKRRTDTPCPATVDEALELITLHDLLQPDKIVVDESGKYPRIIQYLFSKDKLLEDLKYEQAI